MHITLIMVSSIDGKTTRGEDPNVYTWTSPEDQKQFFSLIEEYGLIVMGRKTYENAKPVMKLRPGKLRVVLTREPEKYTAESIPNQLEFYSLRPKELVEILTKRGYSRMLLVGGGTINTLFFQEQLVNELLITIEPQIFGKGSSIVSGEFLDVQLTLQKAEKLNKKGTLLLRCRVVK